VLYNTGASIETVPFEEKRVQASDQQFKTVPLGDKSPFSPFIFGQLSHVPLAMLATPFKDKLDKLSPGQVSGALMTHCTARSFEKLPGFVDLMMLSEDGLQGIKITPKLGAVPICELEDATLERQSIYESLK